MSEPIVAQAAFAVTYHIDPGKMEAGEFEIAQELRAKLAVLAEHLRRRFPDSILAAEFSGCIVGNMQEQF